MANESQKKLEQMIEILNQSSSFFKGLEFNIPKVNPSEEEDSEDDDLCWSRSDSYAKIKFWIDLFEDKNPRYCFAFEIPEKIFDSDIADILPQVWWIDDLEPSDGTCHKLDDAHYEKIIFEFDYGNNESIPQKLRSYKNGKEYNKDAVADLKKTSEKGYGYIVYYLKRSKEKESVKKFEKEFTTFLNYRNQIMSVGIKEDLKELLLRNHNIILHGAPGTGKTYLAKEIAKSLIFGDSKKELSENEQKQFGEQCGFVQFHQSYDYTDFVEGLRPKNIKGNQIGFDRTNGIFKNFCNRALDNSFIEQDKDYSLKQAYESLLKKIDAEEITFFKQKTGQEIFIKEISPQKNIKLQSEDSSNGRNDSVHTVSYKRLEMLIAKYQTPKAFDSMKNISKSIVDVIGGCNASAYWAVARYLLGTMSKSKNESKKFVFIIDEINRGEMSKIFGELFFSIDPGYRGKDGLIKTQYQIIGTMNDIDRSVESMDFAMRRRFAFKEITAKDCVDMLSELKSNKKAETEKRMNNLNNAIEKIPGLSAAYHIGPAYFLKLKNYNYDFDKLWEYHIEGVVKEYLRGMDSANEKLKELAKVYEYSNVEDRYPHG